MLKYDVALEENSDNSLSLILRNINRNSVILEFGPATGRMTRYLSENLNCDVFIVEIDPEAAKLASQYAKKTVIGNIEDYKWLSYFDDIKFDYIIFADVLEHLYDPQRVLSESKRLLKEDGSIFVSIPNFAHNSVIIDLINNNFKYRETGLLDESHLRFFTYFSLMEMFEKSFLKPVKSLATYNRPIDTEIRNDYDMLTNEMLRFLLKNKKFGEVYQFVFELKRASNDTTTLQNIKSIPGYYYSQIFIDQGNGFSERNSIVQAINYLDMRCEISFDLKNFGNIKQLRIDPLNAPCVIKIKEIRINKTYHIEDFTANSTYNLGGVLGFETIDPQIFFMNANNLEINSIDISYDVFAANPDMTLLSGYIEKYIEKITDEYEKVTWEKTQCIEQLEIEVRDNENKIKELTDEIMLLKQQCVKLEKEVSLKEEELALTKELLLESKRKENDKDLPVRKLKSFFRK